TAIGERTPSTKHAEQDARRHARQSKDHADCRAATIRPSLAEIALALSSRCDNHNVAATAKMAILIVAAFSSRLSRYTWFRGPSWDAWRAVLKGAFAEPMTAEELKLFHLVAERDPPRKRVRELWIIAGRRAGKDSVASAIQAYFSACANYEGLLRPGEVASVMCLAVDRDQAKIELRYVK